MKSSNLWWFNPINIYCLLLLLVSYSVIITPKNYNFLYGVATKAISFEYLIIYLFSFIFFYFGVKTSSYSNNCITIEDCDYLNRLYKWLFILCLSAYVIWFISFALVFGFGSLFTFLDPIAMTNNMYIFKQNSGRIPGITSITELGVVITPMSYLLYKKTYKKIYLYHLAILFVLSLIRSVLFSERLAFLEIFVPLIVVFIAMKDYKIYYKYLPILGVIGLFFMFAIFEYVRSWSSYYVNYYDGTFFQFVLDRIVGYYAVAFNTECLYIEHSDTPYFPFRLLEWCWKIPFMEDIPTFWGIQNDFGRILEVYANPEYNNPGGLLIAVSDFGLIGLLFSFFLGRFFGSMYMSFRNGQLLGFILYPACFLCMLELPRYFYFSGKRAIYVIIGMLVIYIKINKIKKI